MRELIGFYNWWRALLVLTTAIFAVLAVTADRYQAVFAVVAILPITFLIGTMGTRTAASHRDLAQLRKELTELRRTQSATPQTAEPRPTADHRLSPDIVHRSPSENPPITVVVTAFNDREYIQDCLESIRVQTWDDFECIVIDDESTDDTLRVAFDTFAADRRFEFVQVRTGAGVSQARNVGIESATGEWITFVDADDFLFPEALETRLAVARDQARNGWFAGSFCNWIPVPETADLATESKDLPLKEPVTWLECLTQAPFIASAPLLRTSVARAVGGFRDVANAEDTEFWMRVLRNGWIFLPVPYTGIAYRQKATSRFRTGAVDHADTTIALFEANFEEMASGDVVAGAPMPFLDSAPAYELAAVSQERLLVALTTAISAGDEAAISKLQARLVASTEHPYLQWMVDAEAIVQNAATRLESHRAAGAQTRAASLATIALQRITANRTPPAIGPPAEAPIATPSYGRLEERRLVHVTLDEARAKLRNRVILMPSAAYHVEELGPLAKALNHRGIEVAFMVSDRRWPLTESGLRSWDYPTYAFPEEHDWVDSCRALVTLNDWGELPYEAVVAGNNLGVPTFAKVEGVQDFNDDDVHWERHAYQTAQHILCQGANDRKALASRESTHIVGSTRLEKIWHQPQRRSNHEQVVVNLNFTYGVLEGARDRWVETVLEACDRVGVVPVFSLHPAEKNRPQGGIIADRPMKHLMTTATHLISRFSTVPFEAMARGVPFIYHNPHQEKVPTFAQPEGAFEITASSAELAAAMESAREWRDSYRQVSEGFFRAQVDIDPDRPSAERTADVIARLSSGG